MVFGQTRHFEFVNFDDDQYVYENPWVQGGLTVRDFIGAFTRIQADYWHPVTMLSHLLDCQIYGLNAGGHHLTNVLIHTANAILLFLLLRQLAAGNWLSAFVAALFAVHPLRVESVAWVAERKDLLCGMFLLLTLLAYVRYARRPWSLARYLPVSILFALGLMSKPMLVTLPFVLCLLDYWPLGRFQSSRADFRPDYRRLIVEKIPLLLLAGLTGVVTLFAQTEAMPTLPIPFHFRIANALVAATVYVGQLFYPHRLAVFYPLPAAGYPIWQVAGSLLFLTMVSALAYGWRKQHPYFLVGWFWYLVMLLPVIGLVQVGGQARADRFTYLPEIGLGLALAAGLAEGTARWRHRRLVLTTGAAVVLTTLTVLARTQTACWRNSETLWHHTLACTTRNAVAENNLACVFLRQEQYDDAITHAQTASEIDPNYEDAEGTLGLALTAQGHPDEAIAHYRRALSIKPDYVTALNNLSTILMPRGEVDEAIAHLQAAVKIRPDNARFHNNLGCALLLKRETGPAIDQFQQAIHLQPDDIGTEANLAYLLATSSDSARRDAPRAVQLAQHVCQAGDSNDPKALHVLAVAYAANGQFSNAVETARQALQLATLQSNQNLTGLLQEELKLYQSSPKPSP